MDIKKYQNVIWLKKQSFTLFSNGNETNRRIFDLLHQWALDVMANMQILSHGNDTK